MADGSLFSARGNQLNLALSRIADGESGAFEELLCAGGPGLFDGARRIAASCGKKNEEWKRSHRANASASCDGVDACVDEFRYGAAILPSLECSLAFMEAGAISPPTAPIRRRIFLARNFLRRRRSELAYRIAGLPTAIRHLWRRNCNSAAAIRLAYTKRFWHPRTVVEALDLFLALLLWPIVLLSLSCLFLWRNGRAIAAGQGRPLHRQFLDQLRLYVAAGILPPMYYVYELHRKPLRRYARNFLLRSETKGGVFHILNREQRRIGSIVSDKAAFADHFREHGIQTVPTLAVFRSGRIHSEGVPEDFDADLFVKPVVGKGGRGSQRWDYIGPESYRSSAGLVLSRQALFDRWLKKSARKPLLVQRRLSNHPDLLPLNNGALSTVRLLTCLDEHGEPELIAAVLRMAIGSNRVVDNAHAGGIAAAVEIEKGTLGLASNLGTKARLGWLDRHPTSGAQIEGVKLPHWQSVRSLVQRAHSTVPGAVLLGWDVAITPECPLLVEANGGPGLEMMQRANRRGFSRERFGQLLAHHLAVRLQGPQVAAA